MSKCILWRMWKLAETIYGGNESLIVTNNLQCPLKLHLLVAIVHVPIHTAGLK